MIHQLMHAIQAQQVSTTRDQHAVSTTMDERSEAARAVARANGIYGYASDRALTREERAFREMLLELGTGMNRETSEELFRQGISSTLKLIRLSKDRLKSIVLNMAKNKSPMCPYPERVFLGSTFEDAITAVISWLKFQKSIGGLTTAVEWLDTSGAMTMAVDRVDYYVDVEQSKATSDIDMPSPFKEMSKFQEFNDNLKTYLRTVRGAANIPIIYAIRETSKVTDDDHEGSVGNRPNDSYTNWDDYSIRFLQHSGSHYESDNAALWQILCKLVRGGPAWDYIQTYGSRGNGDGRKAYFELKGQAYQFSNIRLLVNEAHANIRGLRFDGPSRNWSFDKYFRSWLKNR